jgi:hypothetical protein
MTAPNHREYFEQGKLRVATGKAPKTSCLFGLQLALTERLDALESLPDQNGFVEVELGEILLSSARRAGMLHLVTSGGRGGLEAHRCMTRSRPGETK